MQSESENSNSNSNSNHSEWIEIRSKKGRKKKHKKVPNVVLKPPINRNDELETRKIYKFLYRAVCDGNRANSRSKLRGTPDINSRGTIFEHNFVSALQIYCQRLKMHLKKRGIKLTGKYFDMSSPTISFPSEKTKLLFYFNHSVLCMLVSKDPILGLADGALRIIIDNEIDKKSKCKYLGFVTLPTFTFVVNKFVEKFKVFDKPDQFRYDLFKRKFKVSFKVGNEKPLSIFFPSFRVWAAFVATKNLWIELPEAPVFSDIETYEGNEIKAYNDNENDKTWAHIVNNRKTNTPTSDLTSSVLQNDLIKEEKISGKNINTVICKNKNIEELEESEEWEELKNKMEDKKENSNFLLPQLSWEIKNAQWCDIMDE